MRCEKCGYISFDYLSECRKCGVDLTSIRDALGYLPFKPEIPSFLSSLMKDYGSTVGLPGSAGEGAFTTDVLDTELPEIDFGEELDLGEGTLGDRITVTSLNLPESGKGARGGPGVGRDSELVPTPDELSHAYGKGPRESDEEDLSIDLALESMFQAETPSPATPSRAAAKAPPQKAPSGYGDTDDLNIALLDDDEDLGFLLEDTAGPAAVAPTRGKSAPVMGGGAPAVARKEESSAVASSEDDDLSLELSDDDLESFLQELDKEESPGKKKPKP